MLGRGGPPKVPAGVGKMGSCVNAPAKGMAMGRGHRGGARLGPEASDQVGTRRDYVMVLPGHAGVLVHVHLTHCT